MKRDMTKGGARNGFSLVETVIIIGIISFMTTILATGLPKIRTSHQLRTDTELVRIAISSARYHALNQLRPEECIEQVGEDRDLQRRCSRAGVEVKGGKVTTFIDIDENNRFNTGDPILLEQDLFATVQTGIATFVFVPEPPTIVMYRNGILSGPGDTSDITLQIGKATKTITIQPYGNVEEQK